jgi:hypothetical protein
MSQQDYRRLVAKNVSRQVPHWAVVPLILGSVVLWFAVFGWAVQP